MKQFYQEELDKTERRLAHIRNILQRLGVNSGSVEAHVISMVDSSRDNGGAVTRIASKARKKTGRKSKWELLIMKRLRQLGKPVTYDELTDEIMTFAKLPESKRTSTKQAVVNVIFRLRNRDKKLDTFSVGTREKYIALKSWFEKPGEIKKEYAAKIAKPTSKKKSKTSRRRGRP
ncbi:MAG: hypothetical protein KAT15_15205, partial [Bacteroidales bacterium]|nr:hypothetical protein [Bacteroidales bacterium]